MRKLFLLAVIITSSVLAWAGDVKVSSPNGRLVVNVNCEAGRVYYNAILDGQQVLLPSALGLKTSVGDFTKELSIVDSLCAQKYPLYFGFLIILPITVPAKALLVLLLILYSL